jgi:16S rRNA (cytosine967-C5)-methyltransferase
MKIRGNKRASLAREVALRVMHEMELKETFAEETMNSFIQEFDLSHLDRRFVTELVNGTTKMKKKIDFILSHFLKQRNLAELSPWIRNILRVGIYQLDYMTKIPPAAAVDESVELANMFGHKGTAGLVNALLRNYLRDRKKVIYPPSFVDVVEHFAMVYSYPSWMVKYFMDKFGEDDAVALMKYFNDKSNLTFRLNRFKAKPKQVEEDFEKSGIPFVKGKFLDNFYAPDGKLDLANFNSFKEGWVYIQDESTGLPVALLSPKPRERIVDLCTAPGGKAIYAAELMQNKGIILGVDLSWGRLKLMKENIKKMGAEIITLYMVDSRKFALTTSVDKVLLDAPCSGLGVLGKNADMRWRKSEEDLKRIAKLQLSLLLNAANLVKKKGCIVYSTCSIATEENEEVVEKFLEERKDFAIQKAYHWLPKELVDKKGWVKTFPPKHNMDGSFCVRLERKE